MTLPDDHSHSVTEGVSIPDLLAEPQGQHPLLRRLLWGFGALICFVLGVIGWLVPIVTGIPFYILALVLLSRAWPSVGRWINVRERRLSLRWRLALRPTRRQALLASRCDPPAAKAAVSDHDGRSPEPGSGEQELSGDASGKHAEEESL